MLLYLLWDTFSRDTVLVYVSRNREYHFMYAYVLLLHVLGKEK